MAEDPFSSASEGFSKGFGMTLQASQVASQRRQQKFEMDFKELTAGVQMFGAVKDKKMQKAIWDTTIRPGYKNTLGQDLPEMTEQNQDMAKTFLDSATNIYTGFSEQKYNANTMYSMLSQASSDLIASAQGEDEMNRFKEVVAQRMAPAKLAAETENKQKEFDVKQQEFVRAQQERETEKTERNLDMQTTKFSGTVEKLGVPLAITQLRNLANIVPKRGEDIPGIGRAESLKPDWMAGDAGRKIRQAVAGLKNIQIKDRSGATVTPPEFVRFEKEFGTGLFKTEDQFRDGLQAALNAYKERLRNAYAGVRPEVRDRYFSNENIDDYLSTLDGLDFGGGSEPPVAAPAPGAPGNPNTPPAGQGQPGAQMSPAGLAYLEKRRKMNGEKP